MGCFVPASGGYVFSLEKGNVIITGQTISREKLEEIAKVLGISEAKRKELIEGKIRSIYIYRGTGSAPGGGGGGGSGSRSE